LPTQAAPVIFDRDVGFTLLRHLFEMVNGENVASGISMLGDRVGEQIGSSLVTVVDDPTIRGGIGSRMFDDEGIPSSRTVLVDRGVLKSFLFDTRTGRKTGSGSTGNAKRDNLRSLPTVGHTNLFIDRGDVSPKEILSSTGKGLWLISLAGWWVGMNPSTGDFSSGAKGLWVDGGEVAYPVKNVTVASNLLEMLAGVDAVGDDLYFRHETVSPTMRIGGMQVGGT
jgi:PmbA protein